MVVQVFDVSTHQQTDDPLPITVEVDDMNDNAPTVDGPILCTVAEKSRAGERQDFRELCQPPVFDGFSKGCDCL